MKNWGKVVVRSENTPQTLHGAQRQLELCTDTIMEELTGLVPRIRAAVSGIAECLEQQ